MSLHHEDQWPNTWPMPPTMSIITTHLPPRATHIPSTCSNRANNLVTPYSLYFGIHVTNSAGPRSPGHRRVDADPPSYFSARWTRLRRRGQRYLWRQLNSREHMILSERRRWKKRRGGGEGLGNRRRVGGPSNRAHEPRMHAHVSRHHVHGR